MHVDTLDCEIASSVFLLEDFSQGFRVPFFPHLWQESDSFALHDLSCSSLVVSNVSRSSQLTLVCSTNGSQMVSNVFSCDFSIFTTTSLPRKMMQFYWVAQPPSFYVSKNLWESDFYATPSFANQQKGLGKGLL